MPDSRRPRLADRLPQVLVSVREGTNGTVQVALEGELDMATVPEVEECLVARSDTSCLIVDLSRLTFLDSSGISLILRVHASAERDGWELRIVPGPPEVQRIFELVDLQGRLPFMQSAHDGPAGDPIS